MSDFTTLITKVNDFEKSYSDSVESFLNFIIGLEEDGFKVSTKSLRAVRNFGFRRSFGFTPNSLTEILDKVKRATTDLKVLFEELNFYCTEELKNTGDYTLINPDAKDYVTKVCNILFDLRSFFKNIGVDIKKENINYFQEILIKEIDKFKLTNEELMNKKIYDKKINNIIQFIYNNFSNLLFLDEENKKGVLKILEKKKLKLKIFNRKFESEIQIENQGSLLPLEFTKQEKVKADLKIGGWYLNIVLHRIVEYRFAMPIFVPNTGNVEMFALDVLGRTHNNGPIKFFGQRYEGKHFNGAYLTKHSRTLHNTGESLCDDVKAHIIKNITIFEGLIKQNAPNNKTFYRDMAFVVNGNHFQNTFRFDSFNVKKIVHNNINFGKIYTVLHITPIYDNVVALSSSAQISNAKP